MKIKCPGCHAEFALEAALAADAARSALVAALAMPSAISALVPPYLALFRSAGRALSFARVEALLVELLPMLQSETVMRNGTTRRCPIATWQQALTAVLEHRDSGKLRTPLKTHGYLLEVAYSLADSAAAQTEQQVEQQRRRGAARDDGDEQLRRLNLISRVRGDIELGLISGTKGAEQLREAGINPEVLDG